MSDYDSPWKEALDRYFTAFLGFFFPEVHALLDWSRDHEALDTELRKIAPHAEEGKRLIDRLVKAHRKDTGDPRLIHVEIQVQREEDFARRLHVYNYRIEDVHALPVLTLVVLGDEGSTWRPSEYRHAEVGCERLLRFPTVKLLDFASRLEELENHENPFGVLVAAHLTAQQTRADAAARTRAKLRLLRGLYERKMEGEDRRQWIRFLDWLLNLPEEQERDIARELEGFEQEKKMPYITSFERLGYDRGLKEGQASGLWKAIELGLKLRFGEEGLALMPRVKQVNDPSALQAVIDLIDAGKPVEEISKAIP
jgi:hypothetical protein